MMGLMGVTETVKACRTYLLYPCSYLLSAERVTLSELMFVLANSIDKDRLSIQIETSVSVIPFHRPTDGTDTERSRYLIRSLRIPLNHACQFIQIRIICTPQHRILYRRVLADHLHLSRCQCHFPGQTEHLLSIRIAQFIDHFNRFRSLTIVLNLRIDKYISCFLIIPDMYSERFDTDFICTFQHHRPEDS